MMWLDNMNMKASRSPCDLPINSVQLIASLAAAVSTEVFQTVQFGEACKLYAAAMAKLPSSLFGRAAKAGSAKISF